MTNLVMDSPEALGLALCLFLPEMSQGFIIQTRSGEMQISAANSLPFVREMDRLLKKEISQAQREAYTNAGITPSDMPDLTLVNESQP
ncbi:hypothetical protein ZK41_001380 [Salmonella enterica subsp. enterica serovar Java]|nr:hypothetical protein [Salmonella enterica subsp. enterica serovar Abony]EDW4638725.1 hypothetical protein [Salmonella enterica subsp. enterica serovar Java]EBZ5844332.1 hypothetical protein [Salmonella enterica subsp. enterica serovar Abony]ECA2014956.1 hypothetical protein [Salmonella enterica subsp. enterica serovar Abony]ECB0329424.1 hypothetical protein [Salmonella enterica subsp. enterica serovar Abony]